MGRGAHDGQLVPWDEKVKVDEKEKVISKRESEKSNVAHNGQLVLWDEKVKLDENVISKRENEKANVAHNG